MLHLSLGCWAMGMQLDRMMTLLDPTGLGSIGFEGFKALMATHFNVVTSPAFSPGATPSPPTTCSEPNPAPCWAGSDQPNAVPAYQAGSDPAQAYSGRYFA